MRRAIALSIQNVEEGRGGPFGAIVVRENEIIAEGVNLVTESNDPTAHAEIIAIRGACEKLKMFTLAGCSLYASCEPCPMCLAAIYWARVDSFYFACDKQDAAAGGFDDAFFYEEIQTPPQNRKIPSKQILRAEALAAFAKWQTSTVKIPY